MFRSEPHRCLEKALARLLKNGHSLTGAADASLEPGFVDLLAGQIADQLWQDGFELDPVKRAGTASVALVEEPPYD